MTSPSMCRGSTTLRVLWAVGIKPHHINPALAQVADRNEPGQKVPTHPGPHSHDGGTLPPITCAQKHARPAQRYPRRQTVSKNHDKEVSDGD
jgi:hypothetical protein